jgi:tetratricopeptide (TPR) repeat protein
VIAFLVIGATASAWLLWRAMYPVSPRFDFILVKVNDEPQKVLSGETLSLHPNDEVKVLKITTNLLTNQGVRLVAKDFDVNALRYEEVTLSTLLPEKKVFEVYNFRVWIKYRNQDLGHVDWKVHPYAEDWLDKANRTIDDQQRLAILERALQFAPGEKRIRLRLLDEYKTLGYWEKAAEMLENMVKENPSSETLEDLLGVYSAMENQEGVVSVLERLIELNPSDLEARNQLAEVLDKGGAVKEAINQYEDLLKRVGDEAQLPIYRRLGYLYTQMGDFTKAISSYRKAIDLDENDANLFYNLSYLHEKIGQKETADAYLEKAVSLTSTDVESRLKLARRHADKNELKKAQEYVSQVLKERPRSLEALLLMAQILEQQQKKEGLKDIYQRILSLQPKNDTVIYNLAVLEYETGELGRSLTHFKHYLQLHPKDSTAHEIVFDIYRKQNNDQMAFKQAEILAELKPAASEPYHFMFDYLKRQGDYEGIIELMKKGLEANPQQMDFMKYLALAYLKTQKELRRANKLLESVLNESPNALDTLALRAQVLRKLGEKEELRKTYEKILSLDPKNETVRYNLGVLHYETGKLAESLKYFSGYLKSHKEDIAARQIVFDIHKKQNDIEEALEEARVLIDLKPTLLDPYQYLFDQLSSQGKFEEIIPILEKGLKANPKQTDLRGYLILAYLETGREEQASEQMEEILKVRPDDIKLLLNLARIQEKQGNLKKALDAYARVIQLSPGHEAAEEAYLRLRLQGVQSEGQE